MNNFNFKFNVKRISVFLILLLWMGSFVVYGSTFPKKPIKIIVYTKPGGAIDVFARKFQAIAKKYTSATFVVVNKPGAGGVIAIKHVRKRRNDGYTIAAVTKSNIGKIVSSNSKINIEDFDWMAMMVSDPEAIIVNRNSKINTWQKVVEDAKKQKGKQIWVGPASGGNDHIMALKTWSKAGIKAKWIPYAGGGKAMAALMGGHGLVYVGNPGDVVGKPDLAIAAISSEKRLSGAFSSVPTFKELGIQDFSSEIMWRGFMAKKGIPSEASAFYDDLFRKVNNDAEWKKYITSRGADPVYYGRKQFASIIQRDKVDFTTTLRKLGIIK